MQRMHLVFRLANINFHTDKLHNIIIMGYGYIVALEKVIKEKEFCFAEETT